MGFAMPIAWLLTVAAFIEAMTGLALTAFPNTVARLLLGGELVGVGLTVGRVAGVALLALGVSAWVGRGASGRTSPLAAMLTYNALTAIYLAYIGIEEDQVGILLWPAVVIHAALGLFLIRAWFSHQP